MVNPCPVAMVPGPGKAGVLAVAIISVLVVLALRANRNALPRSPY